MTRECRSELMCEFMGIDVEDLTRKARAMGESDALCCTSLLFAFLLIRP